MSDQAHILIIDDDPLIRRLVGKTLQNAGMQTTVAASGEEGLALFKEHGADTILLDVIMPNGLDGYTTCTQIREQSTGQHIPILMMTGLDDLDSINRAFEAGATDFISKPINIPLLGHRIRYILRAAQTTQSLLDSEKRLHHMAYFDNLTDLPNRTFFQEHLRIMIALAHRHQQKLAVLFLDIDGFKRINDTLGHLIGDQVLQETSNRLRKCLRASDAFTRMGTPPQDGISLARLGGDEFTVLLSSIERNEDAATVAERIRKSLAEPYILGHQEVYTTTSIGISIFPIDGESELELLKNADLAMYYAKRVGGNAYRYFSIDMTDAAKRRLLLDNQLHKAVERNELELHYQPQFDLTTGQYCGVEALLRWNCQELGRISPAEFIPLAEDNGLIIQIGEWVLREACFQAKSWQGKNVPLTRMAVNVSGKQLLHKAFPLLVATVLAETGLMPAALELEVTESALIFEEDSVLEVLQALKKIGVQLSIDDFGTGYSSLSRLMNFPIDCLKIDQSFIRDLEQNSAKTAIVTAIIKMAEGMSMNVIAEGIETQDQLEFVKRNNCKEVQGYLLCKPMPSIQIEAFLRDQAQPGSGVYAIN
ncbi:MAG: EAL domain-containing protein [Methyloglobulus sp.]